jgi:hypothetical protein
VPTQRTPTHEAEPAVKRTFIFLVVLYTSLWSSKCKACGSMEASPVFYWGNLPMPQTPLDTHFYKQIKRTNPRTSHFIYL